MDIELLLGRIASIVIIIFCVAMIIDYKKNREF